MGRQGGASESRRNQERVSDASGPSRRTFGDVLVSQGAHIVNSIHVPPLRQNRGRQRRMHCEQASMTSSFGEAAKCTPAACMPLALPGSTLQARHLHPKPSANLWASYTNVGVASCCASGASKHLNVGRPTTLVAANCIVPSCGCSTVQRRPMHHQQARAADKNLPVSLTSRPRSPGAG